MINTKDSSKRPLILDWDEIIMNFKLPVYKYIKEKIPEINSYTDDEIMDDKNYHLNFSKDPVIQKKAVDMMLSGIPNFYQKYTSFNMEIVKYIKTMILTVNPIIYILSQCPTEILKESKLEAINSLSRMLELKDKKLNVIFVDSSMDKVSHLLNLKNFIVYFEDNVPVIKKFLEEYNPDPKDRIIKDIFIPICGWTTSYEEELIKLATPKRIRINYYFMESGKKEQ